MRNFFSSFLKAQLLLLVVLAAACAQSPQADPATPAPVIEDISPAAPAEGAQPTPTPAALRSTVTIWHSWGDPDINLMVEAIRDFQEIYPDVQFDVLYIPENELFSRYEAAAQGGGGPAVLFGPAEWGPHLYNAGAVADMGTEISAEILSTLNQAAVGGGLYQGALVGLPYAIEGVVLYRNREVMLEAPDTFDRMVAFSNGVTQDETVGAVLERSFDYSGAHLIGIGGAVLDSSGAPAFNNEQGLEWIRLLRAFGQAGPTEFLGDQDLELFKSGKAGLLVEGTWKRAELVEALGEYSLVIDAWPAYQDGSLSGFVQAENIYLNLHTAPETRAAASQFIEYFVSPEMQLSLAESGKIPAAEKLDLSARETEVDRLILQAMEAMRGGATYPTAPEMQAYPSALDLAIKSVFADSIPDEEALRIAEETVWSNLTGASATPAP